VFEDGTSDSASLIVGCDGAHSVVRPYLVGKDAAELEDLDIQMFNLSCSFPKEVALLQRQTSPISKNCYHPTTGCMWWQSIQDVKDPDKPETWLFQNILSWIGAPRPQDFPDQASRLTFWQEKAKEYADPWHTVGENLPKDITWTTDRTTIFQPTMDWSTSELGGVVTIAGDAAHAMPAFRGQGLNNALEDAAKLVDELVAVKAGKQTLSDAIIAYEKEMKARTMVEMPISIAQADASHKWEKLMEAPVFKLGMNKHREVAAQGEAGLA